MPIVQDVLHKESKSTVISVVDCRSAYWPCRVKETDQWKAAFCTHNSLYEITRVPFGTVNSGRTSVKALNIHVVLQPIND